MSGRTAWWMAALGAVLLAWSPARADEFRIGEVAFVPADILDARALPVPGGPPVIMITFAEPALAKLAKATSADADETDVAVTLDGRLLTRIVVRGPRQEPVLTIAGPPTLPEVERLAKEISGKDPLPETLEE